MIVEMYLQMLLILLKMENILANAAVIAENGKYTCKCCGYC
jgi:hypothetical protein